MKKIISFFKDVGIWLLRSSKNPAKVSATIKYAGVFIAAKILPVVAIFGFSISGVDVTDTFNAIGDFIVKIGEIVGIAGTIVYGLRKIWLSGTTPVAK